MLYIRMAVMAVITLYTSRVVLDILGVDDYGIYSIVGSVVVSMGFISNTLASSMQRFFSYELGLGNDGSPQKIYSMGVNIILIFIVVVVILLETIGLWFLNNVLAIPDERLHAANIAYQFSIITFCVSLLRIPYHAMIISYEKMSAYALLSISDAGLKLLLVFLLQRFQDKLISYAILVCVIAILINSCYHLVCKRFFANTCKYKFEKDKTLFKKMFSFSGWTLLGGVTGMAAHEGPNYLMNIFLGVRINAAMGIAKQVSAAVNNFTANFQTAFNPQIVKTYAGKETGDMMRLVYNSSLLSFYLMIVIAIPMIFFADSVFSIWLVDVPEYAVQFSIILMINQMVAAIGSPLWMLAHATGDIKYYQIWISVINLLIIPAVWFVLKIGLTANWVLYVMVLSSVVVLIYRVFFLRKKIGFNVKAYFEKVILKGVVISLLCTLFPYLLSLLNVSVFFDLGLLVLSIVYCCLIVLFIGINKTERQVVFDKVREILKFKH